MDRERLLEGVNLLKFAVNSKVNYLFKMVKFNQYIVMDDHGHDDNHINGILDLTDK